jgi:hypothetical protein
MLRRRLANDLTSGVVLSADLWTTGGTKDDAKYLRQRDVLRGL